MANRRFEQFHFSLNKKLTSIAGYWTLGSSGAVAAYGGNGVEAVTKLATGVYQIQLQDNYNALISANFCIESAPSGSNVSDGSFVANTLYEIVSVGTTDWSSVGVADGITAAEGVPFVASASDGSGNGVVQAVVKSGISSIELALSTQTQLSNQAGTAGAGAILIAQTFAPTSASVTTLVLANGVSGAKIRFELMLRNTQISA